MDKLSRMTVSSLRSVGVKPLRTQAKNISPSMGPSKTQGALAPRRRIAAMSVAVNNDLGERVLPTVGRLENGRSAGSFADWHRFHPPRLARRRIARLSAQAIASGAGRRQLDLVRK